MSQTAIPFQRSATRAFMPQMQNPDGLVTGLVQGASGLSRTAVSPQAAFGAYANERLQGAGTRSKLGRGTTFTSGPMAGQQKGSTMLGPLDDLVNAPVASGPPPRLDTYGRGGKPDYSKLDWLKVNATAGDALKTAERNVAFTGSRDRTAGDALSQKERAISPLRSPLRILPVLALTKRLLLRQRLAGTESDHSATKAR